MLKIFDIRRWLAVKQSVLFFLSTTQQIEHTQCMKASLFQSEKLVTMFSQHQLLQSRHLSFYCVKIKTTVHRQGRANIVSFAMEKLQNQSPHIFREVATRLKRTEYSRSSLSVKGETDGM